MKNNRIIGIDLGGTNFRAGLVENTEIVHSSAERIDPAADAVELIERLFHITDAVMDGTVSGIGIGIPGMVNEDKGIIFDVINIPSWKEIPLKKIMQSRYGVPVSINNDANCFALGEYYFGKGHGSKSMIGLTVGTGLGTGIIINGRLYSGRNCGAGEFGMIDYQGQHLEYYASGQFFRNVYGIDGETVYSRAVSGDADALDMYSAFGVHFGNAIKIILYALEPEKIILGGSVSKALRFFRESMQERLESFAYRQTVLNLSIEVSELKNSAILGAAALHYNSLL